MYQLKRVVSKEEWKDFIELPWDIYSGDPKWVPPLKIAVRDLLDVEKNPFFKHAKMCPLIAYTKEGKRAGRIVAVVDDNHNEYHQEKTGFFGFYEAGDDQALANILLDAAAEWVKSQGMTIFRGPVSPSTNHECGLLIAGFNYPSTVMMTYNPPYYAKNFEAWGLKKAKDLFSYDITTEKRFSERLFAQAERLRARKAVTFRPINMKKFEAEVKMILGIYNDAWEKNWGFVPMNEEEFLHMAKDMKAVLDPNMLLIAEVRGEPVAFALALPDVNQAMIKIKDGKLFPTGLVKLLWNLKGPGKRKTINRARMITLGIKRDFRNYGIGPLFYSEYFTRAPKYGYPSGEASWILEDNVAMNRALEHMCGEKTKTYRIYDRALA